MDWISILQNFGLPVALVVFFVVQGAHREKRSNSRMESLEQYIREKMTDLVEQTNQTIAQNSEVMSRNTEVMGRLERRLEK